MAKEKNNNLFLASFQMAHVVMKRKRPYTELESVVLQCLKIAADTLPEGKSHRKSKANSFIPTLQLHADVTAFQKIC